MATRLVASAISLHSLPKDYPSPPGPPPVGGAGEGSTGGGLALGPLLTVALGPLPGVTPDPPLDPPVLGAGASAGACPVVLIGGAVIAGALVDDDGGASLVLLGWSPLSLLPHAAARATAAAQESVIPSVRIGRWVRGIVFAFGRGLYLVRTGGTAAQPNSNGAEQVRHTCVMKPAPASHRPRRRRQGRRTALRMVLTPNEIARSRTILHHTRIDGAALRYDDATIDELVERRAAGLPAAVDPPCADVAADAADRRIAGKRGVTLAR